MGCLVTSTSLWTSILEVEMFTSPSTQRVRLGALRGEGSLPCLGQKRTLQTERRRLVQSPLATLASFSAFFKLSRNYATSIN